MTNQYIVEYNKAKRNWEVRQQNIRGKWVLLATVASAHVAKEICDYFKSKSE